MDDTAKRLKRTYIILKIFYTVNVIMPNSKLIGIMFDTIMLLIAEISKPVISPKTIV